MENRLLVMKNKTRVFLENYISIFENLSEKNYHQLEKALTSDVIFEDPFNKIKGKNNFIEIFKEMFKKLEATQPIGRMAKPEEIASLAAYICSDEASFVTGSAFDIDGGFTLLK